MYLLILRYVLHTLISAPALSFTVCVFYDVIRTSSACYETETGPKRGSGSCTCMQFNNYLISQLMVIATVLLVSHCYGCDTSMRSFRIDVALLAFVLLYLRVIRIQ